MAHLLLDGTGDYGLTTFTHPTSVTTSVMMRARIEPDDWTPASNQAIFGSNSSRRNMQLRTTGALILELFNGTVAISTATLASLTGAAWVEATYTVGTTQTAFRYSETDTNDPDSATWSALGTAVTDAWTSQDAESNIYLGARNSVPDRFLAGTVYRAQLAYDGTLVYDADPSDTSTWNCPSKSSFTEKANGATVTLEGDAMLIGDCPASGNRIGGNRAIRKPPR